MAAEQDVEAEVEINWEHDDHNLRVTAVLGEASVVVEHAWGRDAAGAAATLIQSLPQIMVAVQQQLNAQEAT